jgi:hypothetical protein
VLLSAIAARLVTEELHGGPRVDVVYLDLDGRAPLHRLVACVELQLASCDAQLATPLVTPSAEEYLDRISLVYCSDMLQLGAALASVRACP